MEELAIKAGVVFHPAYIFSIVAMASLLTSMLSRAVVAIRTGSSTRRNFAKCATVCVIFFGMALACFTVSKSSESLVTSNLRATTTKIDSAWGTTLPQDQRTRRSEFLARSLFSATGRIGNFIDESGQVAVFRPTEADYDTRDKLLSDLNQISATGLSLRVCGFILIFVPVATIVLAMGISGRNPLSRNSSQR